MYAVAMPGSDGWSFLLNEVPAHISLCGLHCCNSLELGMVLVHFQCYCCD